MLPDRLRLFATPHKGLRNVLCKFSTALSHTDFVNREEAAAVRQLGYELFTLLDDHVKIEDSFILSPLEDKSPGSSVHDRNDHENIEREQVQLEHRLASISLDTSPSERHEFYLDFTMFQSKYLAHIYHEEMVTEKSLWENFTDEELLQIRMNIVASMSPDLLVMWWKYIIPAQSINESVNMLNQLKGKSKALYNQILDTIEYEMSAVSYANLLKALNTKD